MSSHHTRKVESSAVGNVRVKIYARKKHSASGQYRVWEVADYFTGSRVLRSFSDHDKAKAEAKRLATLMAAGEANAAQMRGTDSASYGRALELLRPCGVPLELAAAHFAEAFKLLGGDKIVEAAKFFASRNPDLLTSRSVAEVRDELIASKEARGKSERYLQDLRARLTRFSDAFKVNVSNVTTGDVQRCIGVQRFDKSTSSLPRQYRARTGLPRVGVRRVAGWFA